MKAQRPSRLNTQALEAAHLQPLTPQEEGPIHRARYLIWDALIQPDQFLEAKQSKAAALGFIANYQTRLGQSPDLAKALTKVASTLTEASTLQKPMPNWYRLEHLDAALAACNRESLGLRIDSSKKPILDSLRTSLMRYRLALTKILASMRCLNQMLVMKQIYWIRVSSICAAVADLYKQENTENLPQRRLNFSLLINMLYKMQRGGNIIQKKNAHTQADNLKNDEPLERAAALLVIQETECLIPSVPEPSPRLFASSPHNTPRSHGRGKKNSPENPAVSPAVTPDYDENSPPTLGC